MNASACQAFIESLEFQENLTPLELEQQKEEIRLFLAHFSPENGDSPFDSKEFDEDEILKRTESYFLGFGAEPDEWFIGSARASVIAAYLLQMQHFIPHPNAYVTDRVWGFLNGFENAVLRRLGQALMEECPALASRVEKAIKECYAPLEKDYPGITPPDFMFAFLHQLLNGERRGPTVEAPSDA